MLFKSFLSRLLLFSSLPFSLVFLWIKYAPQAYSTEHGWFIVAFFLSVTAFVHYALLKAKEKSSKSVVTYFMALSGLRMLLYFMVILIYALVNKGGALGFGLLFLSVYALFSIFEIISLQQLLRK